MNIKGKSRAGGRELANHLLNAEKNETVKVLTVDGTVAQDLHGAFYEMEAISSGTRCKKPLYHAKISPDPKEPALTPEQWNRAIAALRDQLGLTDHAYAAVLHRKYGAAHPDILREHVHVVFCRINPDTMRAMHDGHNYRQHELVARQLEKEFGHARIQGAHVERDGSDRPPRTPPDWAMQQAVKSGIQPRDVAQTVKQLWDKTDTARSFADALPGAGLTLAVGRRDLVVLDQAGDVHTLARCLNLKVADIRARMADIDRSKLPTVDQARETIHARNAEKELEAPVWDRDRADQNWQDAVIKAAIEKIEAERKPGRGTLAGGGSESKPDPYQAANDNSKRAEINALAEMLHKHKQAEQEKPANDNEAVKQKMAAYGFDPDKPETVAKWQEIGKRVDAGRITETERFREMALYLWNEAHKERQADLKQSDQKAAPDRQRDVDRDR